MLKDKQTEFVLVTSKETKHLFDVNTSITIINNQIHLKDQS